MPIKIMMGAVATPIFICDHCGKRIEESGNSLFEMTPDGAKTGELVFVHIACDKPYTDAHRLPDGHNWQWTRIGAFLTNLRNNIRFDEKPMSKYARVAEAD